MVSLGLQRHLIGGHARIFRFVRHNQRCPSCDFLNGLESQAVKKFKGSFDALTKQGANYHNDERFKALIGNGKPLWEFKEHRYRLYCYRRPDAANVGVDVVLLDGWVKEKQGRNKQEIAKVASAQGLLAEFMAEYPGGVIGGNV